MEQNVYMDLRSLALEFKPQTIESGVVFGVVIDVGMDLGTVTVVSLNDGTASMYLSTGGGTIGAGEHATIREASKMILNIANELHKNCTLYTITEYPLPDLNVVFFYLLSPEGICKYSATIPAVLEESHPFSSLFYSVNDMLTSLRRLQENNVST